MRWLPPHVIASQYSRASFSIHRSAYFESIFGKSKLPTETLTQRCLSIWQEPVVARMPSCPQSIYTHQNLFIAITCTFPKRKNNIEIIGVKSILYEKSLFLSDNSDMNPRHDTSCIQTHVSSRVLLVRCVFRRLNLFS